MENHEDKSSIGAAKPSRQEVTIQTLQGIDSEYSRICRYLSDGQGAARYARIVAF